MSFFMPRLFQSAQEEKEKMGIFTLIMLERGAVPPSYGFEEKPENIAVPPVSELTPFTGSHAMSTSLAFGGCNTALIAGRV